MKKETRVFKFDKLTVEERADGLGPKISGYAAVFNKRSEDMGFIEKIQPGAFKQALKTSDARALFNHDPNFVLGRQSNDTLRVKEDKNGLWMEVDPPNTQMIRDLVLEPIKRGDIKEQSFGFTISKDSWDNLDGERKDEPAIRTIIEVSELFDVSPVTFPAYPDTTVALRSMEKAKESTFKVADESDILNINLMAYLEAKEPKESRTAAFTIIETLMPTLTDEQREKFLPKPEPGSEAGNEGESHEPPGKAADTDQPTVGRTVEDIDKRYKAWKMR